MHTIDLQSLSNAALLEGLRRLETKRAAAKEVSDESEDEDTSQQEQKEPKRRGWGLFASQARPKTDLRRAGILPWLSLLLGAGGFGVGFGAKKLRDSFGSRQEVEDAIAAFDKLKQPIPEDMTSFMTYLDSLGPATRLKLFGVPVPRAITAVRMYPRLLGREPLWNVEQMRGPEAHKKWVDDHIAWGKTKNTTFVPWEGPPGVLAPPPTHWRDHVEFNATYNPNWAGPFSPEGKYGPLLKKYFGVDAHTLGPHLADFLDKRGLTDFLMRGFGAPGNAIYDDIRKNQSRVHYEAFSKGPIAALHHMLRGMARKTAVPPELAAEVGHPTNYGDYFGPKFEEFIYDRLLSPPMEIDLEYLPHDKQLELIKEFHRSLSPTDRDALRKIENDYLSHFRTTIAPVYRGAADMAYAVHNALDKVRRNANRVGITATGAGVGGLLGHQLYRWLTPEEKETKWQAALASGTGMGLGGLASYFAGTDTGRESVRRFAQALKDSIKSRLK